MSPFKRSLLPLALTVSLIAVGCGGSTNQSSTTRSSTAVDASTTAGATTAGATTTGATTTGATTTAATESSDTGASTTSEASATTAAGGDEGAAAPTAGDCDATAATFRKVSSANDSLDAPELAATCDGDTVVVTSNAIPDFTYVASSPGDPAAQDLTFKLPTMPTAASESGDIPMLGPLGVAVDGVPIYGPTEATGGDVLSLEGALSDCGSHNGPTGFHFHLFGSADGVDCLYSAEEVTSGVPLLVGWAADGYPIMSGTVCADDACTSTKQLTSSWELSDDSLFATDTWDAHTYVEGSGDLDRCNGRTDTDGQYRYYTTETFPYIAGCFHGEVANDAIPSLGGGAGGAGGPGGNAGPPPGQ